MNKIVLILSSIFFLACEKEIPKNNGNIEPNLSNYKQYGSPLKDVPQGKDIYMYEVNLRAFSQEGNLKGVTNKIEHLKSLGVNVIWLMPIYTQGEIKSVGSPYSIKDYKSVDNEYGSLDDLRKLTDIAHQNGIAVIIDWVANHTSWDNDWIKNKDWYTLNASGDIIHPAGTNWQDVADLNFENSKMREAMIDALRYWVLEANIDGYRCDHADGVPADFWNQAIDQLQKIPNRNLIMLAEGSRKDHYASGFSLNYGWDYYNVMKSVYEGKSVLNLKSSHVNEYSGLNDESHILRFTTNHDESAWDKTPMMLFGGKEGALAASVATIFSGGVPLIYTGQEVGQLSTIPFFTKSTLNWNANLDMLDIYRKIGKFYQSSDAVKYGTEQNISSQDAYAKHFSSNGKEVLIISNMRSKKISYNVGSIFQKEWTNFVKNDALKLEAVLNLEPHQFFILQK